MSRPGMLTYSGRFVQAVGENDLEQGSLAHFDFPDDDIPTMSDIARSLSRIPRFTGNTRRPWSVADHSLFCSRLAETDYIGSEVPVYLLLHDAHEAMTGDISNAFKTDDIRLVQSLLDVRIMDEYAERGYAYYRLAAAAVLDIDRSALLAEALIIGPPCLKEPSDVLRYFGSKPSPAVVGVLCDMLREGDVGESSDNMKNRFIDRYHSLTSHWRNQ